MAIGTSLSHIFPLGSRLDERGRLEAGGGDTLRDFSVDVERTAQLMGEIPGGMTVVWESGIAEAEQLNRLEEAGVDAVFVGEALMRSENPDAA